jgi:hypothetical protein
MAQPCIFLDVQTAFPDLAPTAECIRDLISKLSRTDALIWCARLNLISSNRFNTDDQTCSYVLNTFFPEDGERQRILTWLKSNFDIGRKLFFRAQMLELAHWIALFANDHPNDGATFTDPGARRTFGQAALVASSLWADRVYRGVEGMSSVDPAELRRNVMPQARLSYEENSGGAVPSWAIGRGYLLWSKYLPRQWPESIDLFRASVGVDVEDYFRFFVAVVSHHVNIQPGSLTADPGSAGLFKDSMWDSVAALRDPFRTLLLSMSLSVSDLVRLARQDDREEYLKTVRAHPILRMEDSRHIVLDPVFLAEQVVVGPLFRIVSTHNTHSNDCFNHFGKAFEAYVADLITTRFPERPPLSPRAFCGVKLRKGTQVAGEIDAAIVTGPRQICLIEAKAVFLRADATRNLGNYHSAVRSRYAAGSESPKGVSQLGRNAALLAAGGLEGLPAELKDIETLWTVLLVNDHNLDAPGHAAFLKREFLDVLHPDEDLSGGCFRKRGLRVTAPILITIDDFEWIEASLANFSLGEFLAEYSAADPDRVSDIRTYARRSRFNGLIRNPEAVAAAVTRVIDDLGRVSFGPDWPGGNSPDQSM